MKNLDGKTIPIGTLLSQDWFFRVPEYQRPFSWDKDNFDDLVSDIVSARRDQDYFLGTVVLHHQVEKGHHDVVDGQQRLTSILILLACLRDLVDDEEFKKGIQQKILQQKNVVDGIPEKIRLEVKDREVFADLVVKQGGTKGTLTTGLPEPGMRYVNAVEVFRSKLEGLNQEELQAIITFVSQRCVVIYLATQAFDDAFRLFTIVNDRGKQLRRLDILKALNLAPDVISKDTVRERIAHQWEATEKTLGEAAFENLFFLIRLVVLKDKPQGDLLKEFQDRVFAKGTIVKGQPFFDAVFQYATLYEGIFIDRDIVPEDDANHTRYRALIHIMDLEFRASEWRACLLSFARKFDGKEFYKFCLKLEKVYLAQWVAATRKDERYAEYSQLLSLIDSAKKPEDVLGKMASDEDTIRKATAGRDIYSAGYGKYLLLRLEVSVAEHDSLRQFTATSIEHVLPQQPDAGGEWGKTHTLGDLPDYVNTIGNLVLLSKSKNSSASNYEFEKKKEKYLKTRVSDYPRSIQVLKYKDWTRTVIDERTKEAADLVLQDP